MMWVMLYVKQGRAYPYSGNEVQAEARRVEMAIEGECIVRKRLATAMECFDGVLSTCGNHFGFNSTVVYRDCPCPDPSCVQVAFNRLDGYPRGR